MRTANELRASLIEKAGEDPQFRTRLLNDPKSTIEAEFDVKVPEGFSLNVHEDSANAANLVLPPNPHLTTQELEAVSGAGPYGDDSDFNDY